MHAVAMSDSNLSNKRAVGEGLFQKYNNMRMWPSSTGVSIHIPLAACGAMGSKDLKSTLPGLDAMMPIYHYSRKYLANCPETSYTGEDLIW